MSEKTIEFEVEKLSSNQWIIWETEYEDGVGSSTACCDEPLWSSEAGALAHIRVAHEKA